MKLRRFWKRIRLQSVPLEGGERRPDNVDGLATMSGASTADAMNVGPTSAPPNWVPSQQDWGKPRH